MRAITFVFGIAASILLPMISASEDLGSVGPQDFAEDSNIREKECSTTCTEEYNPVCVEPVCHGGSPYIPYSRFSNPCALSVYNCLNPKRAFKEVKDKSRCPFKGEEPIA